jgi:AraC-like DNA-binding protein/ligand-binding sensor protein
MAKPRSDPAPEPIRPDPTHLEDARKLALRFEAATGVSCAVTGIAGSAPELSEPCRFCRRAAELNLAQCKDCLATHRYGTDQAQRFGGRYIYFCAANMTHWAVPLLVDGQPVASLIGGPILLIDPDEYLEDELLAPRALDGERRLELRALLGDIPFVSPERATALSEMLYLAVTGLSAQLAGSLPDRAAEMAQRAHIAERIHELKEAGGADSVYPVDKERELLSLISKGDKSNSQRVLNEILGHIFFCSGNDVASIRNRVQELVVLLSRAALDGGASVEEVIGLNNGYLVRLQQMQNVDDIAAWLAGILRRFSECVFEVKALRHAGVIRKAIHFLNANYGRKISVQDVADAVHMSASHFGRVFRDEMGQSVTDYLGRLRVDRSKAMLRERAIPLAEIATRAGFDDQSYFTKVFKRYTGQSPGRYRSAGGRPGGARIEIHE